jgi:hypothetical protein
MISYFFMPTQYAVQYSLYLFFALSIDLTIKKYIERDLVKCVRVVISGAVSLAQSDSVSSVKITCECEEVNKTQDVPNTCSCA